MSTQRRMHEDQVEVDAATVSRLLAAQMPELASHSVTRLVSAATTATIFRVGRRHSARFPLRRDDPSSVRDRLVGERSAMAEFAAASPFPTPLVCAIGRPGEGYPMPWSTQTWIDGTPLTPSSDATSEALAEDLGELIGALRAVKVRGRSFTGTGRGGALVSHDRWVAHCLDKSEGLLPVSRLRRAWAELRLTPREVSDAMCHQDLIPANLLGKAGRLVGVLDTGGFGPADPALDLVCAWHLLEAEQRELLRRQLARNDHDWRRGAAWALQQALGLVWYYQVSNPTAADLGRTTIGRILAAPELRL